MNINSSKVLRIMKSLLESIVDSTEVRTFTLIFRGVNHVTILDIYIYIYSSDSKIAASFVFAPFSQRADFMRSAEYVCGAHSNVVG
jgi:hypothetical protein